MRATSSFKSTVRQYFFMLRMIENYELTRMGFTLWPFTAKNSMIAKQIIGTIYATCMLPVLSEINPINRGVKAPPIIDITRKEDASLVSSPKSLIPSAKIVGNMIDIKKGVAMTAYTATSPLVDNAMISKVILIQAYIERSFAGLMYRIKKVPRKRP